MYIFEKILVYLWNQNDLIYILEERYQIDEKKFKFYAKNRTELIVFFSFLQMLKAGNRRIEVPDPDPGKSDGKIEEQVRNHFSEPRKSK